MTVVAKTGIVREPGYLYFLRGNVIFRKPVQLVPGGPTTERVCVADFVPEEGRTYALDLHGDVLLFGLTSEEQVSDVLTRSARIDYCDVCGEPSGPLGDGQSVCHSGCAGYPYCMCMPSHRGHCATSTPHSEEQVNERLGV